MLIKLSEKNNWLSIQAKITTECMKNLWNKITKKKTKCSFNNFCFVSLFSSSSCYGFDYNLMFCVFVVYCFCFEPNWIIVKRGSLHEKEMTMLIFFFFYENNVRIDQKSPDRFLRGILSVSVFVWGGV